VTISFVKDLVGFNSFSTSEEVFRLKDCELLAFTNVVIGQVEVINKDFVNLVVTASVVKVGLGSYLVLRLCQSFRALYSF